MAEIESMTTEFKHISTTEKTPHIKEHEGEKAVLGSIKMEDEKKSSASQITKRRHEEDAECATEDQSKGKLTSDTANVKPSEQQRNFQKMSSPHAPPASSALKGDPTQQDIGTQTDVGTQNIQNAGAHGYVNNDGTVVEFEHRNPKPSDNIAKHEQSKRDKEANYMHAVELIKPKLENDPSSITNEDAKLLQSRDSRAHGEVEKGSFTAKIGHFANKNEKKRIDEKSTHKGNSGEAYK